MCHACKKNDNSKAKSRTNQVAKILNISRSLLGILNNEDIIGLDDENLGGNNHMVIIEIKQGAISSHVTQNKMERKRSVKNKGKEKC